MELRDVYKETLFQLASVEKYLENMDVFEYGFLEAAAKNYCHHLKIYTDPRIAFMLADTESQAVILDRACKKYGHRIFNEKGK